MKGWKMIGKAIPNVDAVAKSTGEAIYTTDISLPNMLIGKILRSHLSHARILHIDTSKAKKLIGVKAVIRAHDTPKIKFGRMGSFLDKLPLEDKKVRCIGDEIAAVAAIDEDAANEALELIKVDFEELPAVHHPLEAMREGSPKIHEDLNSNISISYDLNYGDVDRAFKEADVIIKDEFRTPSQSHCCMEVHNVIVNWDHSGRITVWTSTQASHAVKNSLAKVCNMPARHFHIIKPHVGGAFGSKVDITPMEPIAVFLAKESGRPVKIENSRKEEFLSVNPRHPTITNLKFGFKKNGKITAKQATVIMDNGAYNVTGPAVLVLNHIILSALYRCPNLRSQGYLVYTNRIASGSFRGFGSYQAMFGHEIMMDMAAEKLKIDPKDIRLINANLPNEITPNKVPITSCGLGDTIQRATEKCNWHEKRKNKNEDFGVGMACMIHTGAGSNTFAANYSGATMELNIDGSITLSSGASDIGQGSNTVLLQIAAEALDISFEDIRLVQGDTDASLPDVGSKGSRTTFCAGSAVLEAARDLRSQILNTAAKILKVKPHELTIKEKTVFIKHLADKKASFLEIAEFSLFEEKRRITGKGFFCQEAQKNDYAYNSPAMIFATQIAEVQVDKETGLVKVRRMTSAHDLGRVINPMLAEGQVEGGVVQGLGGALLEGLVFDNGRIVNANFTDYKILTSMDVPEIDSLWIETDDPNGPLGSKGIAEGTNIPTAAAVANAIYNAIGVRVKSLPITPENILKSLEKTRKG